jgi:putative methyltransferase
MLKKYLEQKVFGHIESYQETLDCMRCLKAVDATAAPGNKTLQLSEFIGEVLSFERDHNRFGVLKRRVHECKASRNVTVINEDFLDSDPSANENLQDIDIVLCDPSCSGSGMKLHCGLRGQSEGGCTLEMETPAEQLERAKNLGKF